MNNNRPLILVTNDDGVDAKGISVLSNAIKEFGDVVVVAPDSARSGQSSAITPNKAMTLKMIHEEENFTVYKTNGTPVDCVKLAMNTLLDRKPDLIVSGINHGSNSAVCIIYSGTMGAVMEGCINNINSVGFSFCNMDHDADFTITEDYIKMIVKNVLDNGLDKGVCLNVNFPEVDKLKGIKICRQASGYWTKEYDKKIDEQGNESYWLTGYFHNLEPEAEDTDEWALSQGYVSVVPCTIDMTAHNQIKRLGYMEEIFNYSYSGVELG